MTSNTREDSGKGLKSAWELALERMDGGGGAMLKLTSAQKTRIADINRRMQAKIAELEIMFDKQITVATSDPGKRAELETQRTAAIRKQRENGEREKQAIRNRQT